MPEFFRVIPADEFVRRLSRFARLSTERVLLDASLHRTLSADVIAAEDLPVSARSTVDGYAVRAGDTLGASDSFPALLEVVAAVEMGAISDAVIATGQAAYIPTGGFLPWGADAVVMIEYTNAAGAGCVEVSRPVTTGSNVLEGGEDVKSGTTAVPVGWTMRPQEIGLLAALGVMEVPVYRRPRVAIISTGDEVVPISRKPQPGQIRDANTHSISALAQAAGAEIHSARIVPDDAVLLREALELGIEQSDVTVLSGGSSVGARDLLADIVSSLADVEVLAHGVAIRPGKPTLLAGRRGKAILGLPGHPVSALIVAQVFLVPFLKYLQGGLLGKGPVGPRAKAVLTTSIQSTIGLEEYVRIRLEEVGDGTYSAHPLFGKSGVLSTMVRADGVLVVPMNVEGFAGGDRVEVIRF